jgi:putative phage-type endonuclease
MANAVQVQQPAFEFVCDSGDRSAWLDARRSGIGASDMACLLGHTRWASPLSLYAEKVGAVEPEDKEQEFVRWGNILEPVIAEEFAFRTGRHIDRGGKLLRSLEHPWALCTLDYWTWGDGVSLRPLEIKNATEWKAEDWADGPPEAYLIQAAQQMLVCGTNHCTVAALIGGNRLVWCDIERDERLIRQIIFAGETFWERVQRCTPPEPDGSDASTRLLRRLYPEDDGSAIELPMDLADDVEEWRRLKAEAKAIDATVKGIENRLKAALGDASEGHFPSGDRVTYRSQTMPERVLPATSFRVMRYQPSKAAKGR